MLGTLISLCCCCSGEQEPFILDNKVVLGRFRLVIFSNIMLLLLIACSVLVGLMSYFMHNELTTQAKPYAALVKVMPCFDELIVPELKLLQDNEYARLLTNVQLCETIIGMSAAVTLVCILGIFVQMFCCSGCQACFTSFTDKVVAGVPLKDSMNDFTDIKKVQRPDRDGGNTGAAVIGTTHQQFTIDQDARSKASCPVLVDDRQHNLLKDASE